MLLRMYLRWAEKRGFKTDVVDYLPGDEAGVKSATVEVTGEYAYGLLMAEVGVHRLVRISPFDSAKRRHTSFASLYVWPELPEDVDIVIDDKDLRVDTYRSSGAGGQHVNVTDSAIRLTHLPTGIVVSCQNERSQHKNRASAMKVLKARLYDLKLKEQQAAMDKLGGEKKEIGFGSQIRSYVMQPYQMVKDLRSRHTTGDVAGRPRRRARSVHQGVPDGEGERHAGPAGSRTRTTSSRTMGADAAARPRGSAPARGECGVDVADAAMRRGPSCARSRVLRERRPV